MITFTKAYLPDREKLSGYIDRIYETAWLTNNSQFCKELEARLKEHLGVKHLILVANGTLALQVAYKALDIKGSAITTPFSFVATSSSLLWEGIRPIFADIDRQSWNLDQNNIEQFIEEDTSAIVPVHLFGNPCEVEGIADIARRHGLKVIYDGAHAFDVTYKTGSVLNWGDIATLSFHATKLFHTIEGGAIITSDDDLAQKIRLMINFGITGPETIECMGINCKMNEFQAAMGLCVLDEMTSITSGRKRVWEFYRHNLPKGLQMQQWNAHGSQNYHYYPVLFESEEVLKKAVRKFNTEQIFPRRYFYPSLHSLKFMCSPVQMPISHDIAGRILCLPLFPELANEELQKISHILLTSVS